MIVRRNTINGVRFVGGAIFELTAERSPFATDDRLLKVYYATALPTDASSTSSYYVYDETTRGLQPTYSLPTYSIPRIGTTQLGHTLVVNRPTALLDLSIREEIRRRVTESGSDPMTAEEMANQMMRYQTSQILAEAAQNMLNPPTHG